MKKFEYPNWIHYLCVFLTINRLDEFDYPSYGGLPANVYRELSSEMVNYIQEHINLTGPDGSTLKQWLKRILALYLLEDEI